MMRKIVSGTIGIVGGIIDVVVGFSILQNSMATSGILTAGYSILALGVIVLLTGAYVLVSKMINHRFILGVLMVVYGLIMLALGGGMIGRVFNFMMMQDSTISGITMIIMGIAMLYSGLSMTR
ncbi:MAG: hypothetical protein ABSF09_04820 [Candidatus Bathyarchaeia archaeon]|jgi:hypothetical protein